MNICQAFDATSACRTANIKIKYWQRKDKFRRLSRLRLEIALRDNKPEAQDVSVFHCWHAFATAPTHAPCNDEKWFFKGFCYQLAEADFERFIELFFKWADFSFFLPFIAVSFDKILAQHSLKNIPPTSHHYNFDIWRRNSSRVCKEFNSRFVESWSFNRVKLDGRIVSLSHFKSLDDEITGSVFG